jgi:hypothetical protein
MIKSYSNNFDVYDENAYIIRNLFAPPSCFMVLVALASSFKNWDTSDPMRSAQSVVTTSSSY